MDRKKQSQERATLTPTETGDYRQSAKNLIPLLRRLALGAGDRSEPKFNWTPELLLAAQVEKLTPWLYSRLAPQSNGTTPAWVLEAARLDYITSLASSVLAQEALQEILVALSQQQIRVIILKGAILGPVIYGNAALRPVTDLDLLVPEVDLERAYRILASLGYYLWCFEPLPGSSKKFGYALGLTRSGAFAVNVDLHWEIRCHGGCYRLPNAALWEAAIPGELYGQPVFFLSPEMTLIHLAVHALTHPGSLIHRLDVVLLLQKFDLDWDLFLAQARQLGVMRPVYWFSQELGRDWEVYLPPSVIHTLAAYRPRWWEDWALGGRGRRVLQRFIGIGNVPGFRNQVRYLWAHVCPPAGFRERRYGGRCLPHLRSLAANLFARPQIGPSLQLKQCHPQGRVQPPGGAEADQLQNQHLRH